MEEESDVEKLLVVKRPAESILLGSGAKTVPPNEEIGKQLLNPRAVHHHGDPMDLVGLAREVQQADQFMRATTSGKLQVIVDTIRNLQEQAQQILETAKRDAQLHHAACNFTKVHHMTSHDPHTAQSIHPSTHTPPRQVPGKTYHLYQRDNGSTHISMLSPDEWGPSLPHKHLGSYRLEHDRSWTPAEEVERRSKDMAAIDRALFSHTALGYSSSALGEDSSGRS